MDEDQDKAQPKKSSSQRSPNYPAFSLEDAISKARALYSAEGKAPVPVEIACRHWDLKHTGGAGIRCVATMRAFGLVDDEGQKDDKRIRLSLRGLVLVRHPDQLSAEYQDAARAAALEPKIHREVWNEYGENGLPSDDALQWALERRWKFHGQAISMAADEIRATFAFAKLVRGDKTDNLEAMPGGSRVECLAPTERPTEHERQVGALKQPSTEGAIAMMPNAAETQIREQPLPLPDAGNAVLRFPYPMSNDDFDWMIQMLQKFRKRIVAPENAPTGRTEEDHR